MMIMKIKLINCFYKIIEQRKCLRLKYAIKPSTHHENDFKVGQNGRYRHVFEQREISKAYQNMFKGELKKQDQNITKAISANFQITMGETRPKYYESYKCKLPDHHGRD